MKKIMQYTLPVDGSWHEYQLTHLPALAAPGLITSELNFWALDDDECKRFPIMLTVVATGEPLPDGALWVCSTEQAAVPFSPMSHVLLLPPREMAEDLGIFLGEELEAFGDITGT